MNWGIVLSISLAILLALIIFGILHRAFRVVVVAVVLAILVPICVTIMCGEGETYVARFASLFSPRIEQQINDGYHDFSEAEKKNPVLDSDGMHDAFNDLWNAAKDKVETILPDATPSLGGHGVAP